MWLSVGRNVRNAVELFSVEKKEVFLLWMWVEIHLHMYRKEMCHFENKEHLSKVSVLRHGLQLI
jgi:hypothetical protein